MLPNINYALSTIKLGDRLGDRLGDETGEAVSELTPVRRSILELMKNDAKISAKQLAAALGISKTAVEKNIEFLKAGGWLQRQGSARSGYWEVKRW